jgi:hypothetical protein
MKITNTKINLKKIKQLKFKEIHMSPQNLKKIKDQKVI